jgi:hypothetical protein
MRESEWIPLTEKTEIDDCAIVTKLIIGGTPPEDRYVTIGFPGWGNWNGAIAYMHFPEYIHKGDKGWKSEYRGDAPPAPKKDKRYIVQLENKDLSGYYRIDELCYSVKGDRLIAVPSGWEVIAWMEFPMPYIGRRI